MLLMGFDGLIVAWLVGLKALDANTQAMLDEGVSAGPAPDQGQPQHYAAALQPAAPDARQAVAMAFQKRGR